MIYGYIRISTDKQQVDNQFYEIKQYAEKHQIIIDRWVEETISSRQDLNRRKLGPLLRNLRRGDVLITCELSRLGRNLLQVMSILHHCMCRECQVWTIKENYRLGADIQSKVLAFAFGLSAEIERNLISQRTKEALARLKAEGQKLGRPTGRQNRETKLNAQVTLIQRMLKSRVTKAQIAQACNVSQSTLYRFLNAKQFGDMMAEYLAETDEAYQMLDE